MKFAQGTTVAVEKSRAEIEHLIVRKYGAREFTSGLLDDQAAIQFALQGRRVRFVLNLPDQDWARDKIMAKKRSGYYNRSYIPASVIAPLVDAEHRRRWRCLLLAIKAKLEVVESGISTFEQEFLAHIVVDERTVWERVTEAQANGRPLLPPVAA